MIRSIQGFLMVEKLQGIQIFLLRRCNGDIGIGGFIGVAKNPPIYSVGFKEPETVSGVFEQYFRHITGIEDKGIFAWQFRPSVPPGAWRVMA